MRRGPYLNLNIYKRLYNLMHVAFRITSGPNGNNLDLNHDRGLESIISRDLCPYSEEFNAIVRLSLTD